MAKIIRHIKGYQVVDEVNGTTSYEQIESYNDSMLPDPAELAKLNELNPEFMPWLMEPCIYGARTLAIVRKNKT